MWEYLKDLFNIAGSGRDNPEGDSDPCRSGECGQAISEFFASQAAIKNACAWMAFIWGLFVAAMAILASAILILVVAALLSFIFPGTIAVALVMLVMALGILTQIPQMLSAAGRAVATAQARQADAFVRVQSICPPECLDGLDLIQCSYNGSAWVAR